MLGEGDRGRPRGRLTGGCVIAKHGDEQILERVEVVYGAHPAPDEGCVDGCRRILQLCEGLQAEDLVFTVVGNGVSSLLTLPAPPLTIEDLHVVTGSCRSSAACRLAT